MRVDITVPYLTQWDNQLSPGGSCNMTSLGMALLYYKKTVPGPYSRISDNLLRYCDQNSLDRHSLDDIAKVARKFGLGDNASYDHNFDEIKQHLQGNDLVIIQGTFTPSGHVVLVCGFDSEQGTWLVNDPAGRYDPVYRYSGPYWKPGERVSYPSLWFRAHSAPDGKVWAHLLSKVP